MKLQLSPESPAYPTNFKLNLLPPHSCVSQFLKINLCVCFLSVLFLWKTLTHRPLTTPCHPLILIQAIFGDCYLGLPSLLVSLILRIPLAGLTISLTCSFLPKHVQGLQQPSPASTPPEWRGMKVICYYLLTSHHHSGPSHSSWNCLFSVDSPLWGPQWAAGALEICWKSKQECWQEWVGPTQKPGSVRVFTTGFTCYPSEHRDMWHERKDYGFICVF